MAASILVLVCWVALLPAATYTYSGASGGDWGTAANWTPSTGFPVSGDTAVFNSTVTVNLNAAQTVTTLQFTTASAVVTLQSGTGINALTIAAGGGIQSDADVTGANTIACNVILAGATTITNSNNATGTLVLAGAMSGAAGSLTKAGPGILILKAFPGTYGGATVISAGTVKLQSGTAPGLSEGLVNGANAFDTASAIPNTSVQLSARWGDSTAANGSNIYPSWGTNTTWGYSGSFNVPTAGTVYFGKRFDDGALLKIDGVSVISDNGSGNTVATSKVLTAGWHTIELRFGQGGGGVGPNASNFAYHGLAWSTDNATWKAFADPGDGSLLTTTFPASLPSTTALSIASGATLDLGGCSQQVASLSDAVTGGTITNSGASAATLTVNAASSTTFSGVIANGVSAINLVKSGLGTLTLAGNCTFTGTKSITGGTLLINGVSSAASGAVTVGNSATLGGTGSMGGAVTVASGGNLSPGNNSAATLTLAAGGTALDLSGGGGTTWFDVGTTSDQIVCTGAASIVKLGGTLVVTNSGGLAAGSYTLMTFTGATTSGSFSTVVMPPGFAGSVGFDNGAKTVTLTVTAAATKVWTGTAGSNWSTAGNWTGGTPGVGDTLEFPDSGLNKATCTNDLALTFNAMYFSGTAGGYTISGPVTLTGGIISNAGSGTTNTISSNLTLSAAQWFTSATAGGTLRINGTIANGAYGLTCSGAGDVYLNGILGNGAGGLTKWGAGLLTLNGANTFTGAAAINAGTATISNAGGLGAGTVSMMAGSILNLSAGQVTYTGLSTSLSGAGTVNVSNMGTGSASTNLNGNYAAFTGTWNIGVGAASGAGKVAMGGADNAAATVNVLTHATLYGGASTKYASVYLFGGVLGEPYGQLRLDGGNWAGPVFLAGAVSTASTNYANFGSTGTGTITGVIAEINGSQKLVARSTTSMILLGANTYTGGTTNQNGNLQIGNGYTVGTLGTGAILLNGGTLVFNHADAVTVTDIISGGGGVTQNGGAASVLTLSGANTYTGATTVSGGTLKAGIASVANVSGAFGKNSAVTLANTVGVLLDITGFPTQIGSLANGGTNGGNVAMGSGDTLTVGGNNASTVTFAGIIQGTGGNLTKIGTGTQILTGANSYTGTTTISGGILQIGNQIGSTASITGTLGSGPIVNNGILSFARTDAVADNHAISGTGTIGQMGTGTLTLNGVNTCSGPIAIAQGTVQYGAAQAVATISQVIIGPNGVWDLNGQSVSAGTVKGSGSISLGVGTLTVGSANTSDTYGGVISGAGGVVKSGTGIWTLTNANTYGGSTVVNAGKVRLANAATDALAHRWSFTGDLTDSVGGVTATLAAGTTAATQNATSITLPGGATNPTVLGTSINLGSVLIHATGLPVTIELWATPNVVQNWSRIFDFGNGTGNYLMMSWTQASTAGSDTVEWKSTPQDLNYGNTNQPYTVGTPYHITMIIQPVGSAGSLVEWFTVPSASAFNTAKYGAFITTNTLANLQDNIMYVGRSQYSGALGGDYIANATYDEFRLWNGAVSSTVLTANQTNGPDTLPAVTGALPSTTAVTLNGTASLDLNGISQTVASLTAATGTTVLLGSATLTTGGDNTSTACGAIISGAGNVIKNGSGAFTLSAASTYAGTTTVSNGSLVLANGAINGTGLVTIASGATLGGTGSIGGSVTNNGIVDPGTGVAPSHVPGKFTIGGNFLSTTGSSVVFDVIAPAVTAGTDYDQLNVTGTVDVSAAALSFPLSNPDTAVASRQLVNLIVRTAAGATAASSNVAQGATVTIGVNQYSISYLGGDGNDVILYEKNGQAATVYVSSSFSGSPGSGIADADFGTTGNQGATFGVTAFATIANALTAVAPGGTIVINSGTYPESVSLGSNTGLRVTGPNAGQTVTINDLTTATGSNIQLDGNALLTIGTANPTTLAGLITGSGSLAKQGAGTVTLSGANTYTGSTTVNGGVLKAGIASVANTSGAFGKNSAVTLANNAGVALDMTGFDTQLGALAGGGTTGGNVTMGAASLTVGASSTNTTFAGVIAGTGNLTKIGTGSLILTGNNAYVDTTLTTGTLQIGNGACNAGSPDTAVAGTGLSGTLGTGNVSIASGTTLKLQRLDTAYAINGLISGGGALYVDGVADSLVSLTGSNSAFTGSVTINRGGLRITNSDALGSGAVAKAIVMNNGSAGQCSLRLDGSGGDITLGNNANWTWGVSTSSGIAGGIVNVAGNNTVNGVFTLNSGGGGTRFLVNGGTMTLAGNVTTSTGGRALVLDGAGNGTFSGVLNNVNAPGLTKQGAGTWTLTGGNLYSGTTTITTGTLQVGSNGTTGNLGTGAVVDTGILVFARTDLVTVGNTISGTLGLVRQDGSGTLTITGNNTYTGGTIINAGTVNAGGRALGSGLVNVVTGANLVVTGTTGLAARYYGVTPVLANFNTLNILQSHLGAQNLVLANIATSLNFGTTGAAFPSPYNALATNFESIYTGRLAIPTAGLYTFNTASDDGSMLWIDGIQVVNNNYSQPITTKKGSITLTAGVHDIAVGYNQGGSGYGMNAQISGPGDEIMADITTANATITPDLLIGSLTGGGTVSLSSGNLVVGLDNASTTFSGVVTGAGGMVKAGSGTLILTGSNTYAGTTTIATGILQIGNATATGTLGSGDVSDNATLSLKRSDTTYGVGAIISGNGVVVIDGGIDSLVTLSGVNTFTGGVTITSGGLAITNSSALGTGSKTLTMTNAAGQPSLRVDGGGGAITLAGAINLVANSGAGNWGGIVNVAGANAINGSITLGGGATRFRVDAGALSLIGNATTNAAGATLILDGAGVGTFSGALNNTNTPALTKQGAGTWTLGGVNTYAGATTVNAGTLLVTGSTTPASTVNVAGIATLGGTGTVGGTITLAAGATMAPGTGGTAIGTLTTGVVSGAGTMVYAVDLNGVGSAADRINAPAKTVAISNATLVITSIANAAFASNYTILSAGTVAGTFKNFPDGRDLPDGTEFEQLNRRFVIHYTATTVVLNDILPSFVWSGLGADDNWTTPENWFLNVAPRPGSDLVFTGTYRTTPVYDFANDTVFNSISFTAAANQTPFTLASKDPTHCRVVLTGGITNSTALAETVSLDLALASTATFNAASGDILCSGILSGAGGLTKTGSGKLNLAGIDSYAGATTLSAGTLLVHGSITSSVTAAAATTLGGSGTINGNLTSAGTVAPQAAGGGTGVLTVNGSVTASGSLQVRVNGTAAVPGADYDQLVVNGFVNLTNGGVDITGNASGVATNQVVVLILNDDAETIAPALSPAEGSALVVGSASFIPHFNGGSGNDLVLIESGTPVLAYVDQVNFAAVSPGQFIVDADQGTLNSQSAIMGVTAFVGVNEALSAIAAPGSVTVNSGSYGQAVILGGARSLIITGPNAPQSVTLGSLATDQADPLAAPAGQDITIAGTSTLTFGDALVTTIACPIHGTGNLVKQGTALTTLSGPCTWTGATTINAGTLVTGSLASRQVTVAQGATLQVSSSLGGPLDSAGTVVVNGGAVGLLTVAGDVTLHAASTLVVDVDGATADRLLASGTVALAGSLSVASYIHPVGVGTDYIIIHANSLSGTFTGLPNHAAIAANGRVLQVQYDYAAGNVILHDLNSAPVLDASATPTLDNVRPGAPSPAGAVGTLVSSLVQLGGVVHNVTDLNADAVTGMAVTAVDEAHGAWWFSRDGGSTWALMGVVSDSSALLLSADDRTRVYFAPIAGWSGLATMTFRAWDQTGGSAGQKVNVSVNGGSTPYSLVTDQALGLVGFTWATITIEKQTYDYDGTPKPAVYTVSPNVACSVTYTNWDTPTPTVYVDPNLPLVAGRPTVPTEPGRYAVKVVVTEANYLGEGSAWLTIKAPPVGTDDGSGSGGGGKCGSGSGLVLLLVLALLAVLRLSWVGNMGRRK